MYTRGGVTHWVARLTRNVEVVGSRTIKGTVVSPLNINNKKQYLEFNFSFTNIWFNMIRVIRYHRNSKIY